MKFAKKITGVALSATMLMSGANVLSAAATTAASETAAETTAETTAESAADTTAETSAEETTEATKASVVEDMSNKKFEDMYGSQLATYLNHEYTYNGTKIPVQESNFYVINSFSMINEYAINYQLYPVTSENYADLNADITGPDEKIKTLGDLLIDHAEKTLMSTYASVERAGKEGLTLSDEKLAEIDDMLKQLENNGAASSNLTLEGYIKLYYGPDVTIDVFKKILNNYYLNDLYVEHYCKNYNHKAEDKEIPNIRYVLFYAPDGSSEDELNKAKKAAEDFRAKVTDLDSLKKLGDEAAAKEDGAEGKAKESGDFTTPKGKAVKDFENWAWDASRKEGDIEVIKSTDYGYFVVGYLGKVANDDTELTNIATDAYQNELLKALDDGTIKFSTDKPYDKPVAVASPTPAEDSSSFTKETEASSAESEKTENKDSKDKDSKDDPGVNNNVLYMAIGGIGVVLLIVAIVIGVNEYKTKKGGKSGKSSKNKKSKK
ncbi:MAG: peptidylprolyl isomerase [Clostridiales bacterium]|nr:peptidylprolyl isomerase [Clostridiales bacterium]